MSYLIYVFLRRLKFADRYIMIQDGMLVIRTNWLVMHEDISSVTLKRNFLGLKELQIRTKSGKVKRLKAYFLKTPAEQVLADLNDWASV